VAINKLDTTEWSKGRFDEVEQQVTGFLQSMGFPPKNITSIPISGLNGDNIVRRSEEAAVSWYTGPTLIEALDNTEALPRNIRGPFRMAISENWKSAIGQVTVSGRIDKGTIQIGDTVVIQPGGDTASVRSIMVDTDICEWAVAGDGVSLALTGIDGTHIRTGDIMSHTDSPIGCDTTFKMKAMAFEHIMPMPVDLYRGRLHSAGQVVQMDSLLDKASGAVIKKNPIVIQPGAVARIVIKLESKIPLEAGQRVVIRSGGNTVACGLVE
jgi:elongation factor 1 alpha-like protein